MKRLSLLAPVVAAAMTISSCYTNPVTGRRGLSLVDESTMESMAAQQYASFLSQNRPVAAGNRDAEMVKRVGNRIASGVQTYLSSTGNADQIANYRWEFNLVNSNDANAWCMPGGKVVVYTGILPLTQNEAGLAVVMGHEIGHAIARHASERASQQMAAQFGTQALGALAGSNPGAAAQVFNAAVGIGAQGALLKFSRSQESEADHIGLIFDALAGYNPSEAIPFWQRMAAQNNGQNPPEFLSTHPSDARRIADIQGWLPEAMRYYRPAGGGAVQRRR